MDNTYPLPLYEPFHVSNFLMISTSYGARVPLEFPWPAQVIPNAVEGGR